MATEKRINTLSGFIEWVKDLNPSSGAPLYRGLSSEDYELDASIVRRTRNLNLKEMWRETVNLIKGARAEGYDRDPTRRGEHPSTDFELLALLQHHGAATPLMDFTYNPLVALWFACKSNSEKNGKIVAVAPTDVKFREISISENYIAVAGIITEIDGTKIQETEQLWRFTPPGFDARILAQNSEFIFGKMVLDEINDTFATCVIARNKKEEIRQELEKFHGISEKNLFRDLHGYAKINAYVSNIKEATPKAKSVTKSRRGIDTPKIEKTKPLPPTHALAAKSIDTPEIEKTKPEKEIKSSPDRVKGKRASESPPLPSKEYRELAEKALKALIKHDFLRPEEYQEYTKGAFELLSKHDSSDPKEIKSLIEEMLKLSLEHKIPHSTEYKEFAKSLFATASKEKSPHFEFIREFSEAAIEYNQKGINYLQRNQFDEAISNFSKAIELNPNYAEAYYNRGIVYNRKGEFDKAIVDFNEAIDDEDIENKIIVSPKLIGMFYTRGVAYNKADNHDKAITDFSTVIRVSPDPAEAYCSRATVYIEQGNYGEALTDFAEAIKLKPEFARAYNNRGIVHCRKDDYDKAIEDFHKTGGYQPAGDLYKIMANFYFGIAYGRTNKHDQVANSYWLAGNDLSLFFQINKTLYKRKATERELRQLEKVENDLRTEIKFAQQQEDKSIADHIQKAITHMQNAIAAFSDTLDS